MAKSVKKVAAKVAAAKSPVIKLLVKDNPKRGKSASRYSLYKDGMSVASYVEKSVRAGNPARVAKADLRWDEAHKFISVE
jgi:hypothetical protein